MTTYTQETTDRAFIPAPANMTIDKKLIKRMVGEAVQDTDGVLGLKGSITDLFKDLDDPTRGVSIRVNSENEATARMRVITEAGMNIPAVVSEATEKVVDALQNEAGLKADEVTIRVVGVETIGDYLAENYRDASDY